MVETNLDYQLRTKKQVRATIKREGSHYVVSLGGRGMSLAFSMKEAKDKQKKLRQQVKEARMKKRRR